ncbi:MAG: hypothetical protein H6713_42485 [Myxococcales bacterium]|nr:hypothetical protein [Myxococcales bacterium]
MSVHGSTPGFGDSEPLTLLLGLVSLHERLGAHLHATRGDLDRAWSDEEIHERPGDDDPALLVLLGLAAIHERLRGLDLPRASLHAEVPTSETPRSTSLPRGLLR